jgi:hypothetical protein
MDPKVGTRVEADRVSRDSQSASRDGAGGCPGGCTWTVLLPGQRIWVIQDNPSSHWTKDVRRVARQLSITLVRTPTYASWLNRIECHFGVMVNAVFAGSDYQDHEEIQAAVAAYLRLRNAEARRNATERRVARQARRARRRVLRRLRAVA